MIGLERLARHHPLWTVGEACVLIIVAVVAVAAVLQQLGLGPTAELSLDEFDSLVTGLVLQPIMLYVVAGRPVPERPVRLSGGSPERRTP